MTNKEASKILELQKNKFCNEWIDLGGITFKAIVEAYNKAIVLLNEQQEIIRCKDCKYWNADDHDCNIKVGWFPAQPNWFCADGVKKE